MRTLPIWKIKRELGRVLWQTGRTTPVLSSYLFGAIYYDLFKSHKVEKVDGKVALGTKVAIYLIFPGSGLSATHLQSLKYLNSKGYSPIVVSNLPLSEGDKDALREHCWIYLQRPNYGYDFGGYREGMRFLGSRAAQLERLLIVNDSTWFPVPNSGDWISEAENLGVDYAAAASNYGIVRPEIADFQTAIWDYRTTHPNFHYCSFALMFSQRILEHPGFQRFWRWFPMTNNKTRTVRRGEIGLSQWIIRRGFTHRATGEVISLDKELAALSDSRLHRLVENLIIPEEKRLSEIKKKLLSFESLSRADMIGLVLTTVARQGSSYALAEFAIRDRGFSFLKKSPVWLDEDASDVTIRLAQDFPGPEGTAILNEALELRARRAPRFAVPKIKKQDMAAPVGRLPGKDLLLPEESLDLAKGLAAE